MVPIISEKRSSLDISRPPIRQIIIPDIRTEQFTEQGPRLLLSSATPTTETVLPHHEDSSGARPRPKDWRSQTAFELSSSIESEASAIVNEFLNKTQKNEQEAADFKLESYV